ncbi:translocation protein SEC62 [Pseudohyphozyma bogoriensis]|nr:translocation protein SEC62 [Pseudohyphozyma bogoriensis]
MENQAKCPPELRKVVTFLRNKAGIKTKIGVLNGKRTDYFKGKHAIKALLTPAYASLTTSKTHPAPKVSSETEATALLHSLLQYTFFLQVTRQPSGTPQLKALQIVPNQSIIPDEYYVWLLDVNPIKSLIIAVGMVAVVLAAVMFPLWPVKLRIGVWYLSIGVLGLIGLFFGIAIVRLIFWVITIVVAKPGIWIFPNLFADVGFVDSFIPLWGWDVPPPKKVKGAKKERKEKKDKSKSKSGGAAAAVPEAEGPKIVELEEGDE